jgi:hypothetical protein
MPENTIITERQRLHGVIKGTDTRYIKSKMYQAWADIVEQYDRGEPLSSDQVNLLEMVNARSSANRHYQRQRDSFNHAAYRIPQTVRG